MIENQGFKVELDLGQSAKSTAELGKEMQTAAVIAQQGMVPALQNVDHTAQEVTVSHRNLGSTLLSTSYAVQDFTSQLGTRGLAGGLAAVQNNIPQILVGLGVGAGMTGVASVAAVAVGALASNWDSVKTLWESEETAKEAKRMADLAKATEDANEAGKKFFEQKSKEEMSPAAGMQKAADVYGGKAVRREIEQALLEGRLPMTPEEAAHLRRARSGDVAGDAEAQAILDEIGKRAEEIAGGVKTGDRHEATVFRDLMMGRNTPLARVALGGKTDAEKKREEAEAKRQADQAAAEAQVKAAAEQDKLHQQALDAQLNAQHKEELKQQQKAEERAKQSMDLARRASQALASQRRDTQQGLSRTVSEERQTQADIQRLQEASNRALTAQSKGLDMTGRTHALVAENQRQIGVLMAKLQQLERQENELTRRNTLLNRGVR